MTAPPEGRKDRAPPPPAKAPAATVLIITDAGAGLSDPTAVPLPFSGLTAALLTHLAPVQVICALMTADHDALQVAARLADLGWQGRLTVRASGLPDHRMVEAELRARAPRLTIEVVNIPDQA